MKAYIYGADGAEITEVVKSAPKGPQVLVRVRACGLNRADLGMTKGHAHGSASGGEGVDLIVDQVSGKVSSQNLAATKIKGRIVNVGRLGGTHADFNFDLH